MDTKNYTQVLIDGKIYTLGGTEDEAYLQKAASYVNEKKYAAARDSGFLQAECGLSAGYDPVKYCRRLF